MSTAAIQPIRKETADAMKMVGMIIDCNEEDTSNIPEVWHQFGPKIDEVPGNVGGLAYGVIWNPEANSTNFKYMAAVNQEPGAEVPEGMETLEIPETTYAVFEHVGSLDNLKATIHSIFGSWKPQSGEQLSSFPSMLEVYGEEFDAQAMSGRIELWVALA